MKIDINLFGLLYRYAGQVGYVVTGMRKPHDALIGDTFYHVEKPVQPFPGFRRPKPMVGQQKLYRVILFREGIILLTFDSWFSSWITQKKTREIHEAPFYYEYNQVIM